MHLERYFPSVFNENHFSSYYFKNPPLISIISYHLITWYGLGLSDISFAYRLDIDKGLFASIAVI